MPRIVLLLCFYLLSSCATSPFAGHTPTNWIPFQLEKNAIVFSSKISGQTVRSSVDTGANYIRVSRKIAKQVQLPEGFAKKMECIGGTAADMRLVRALYEIDGIEFKATSLVGDMDEMEVDVIYGTGLLEEGGLEIDFKKGRLRFFDKSFHYSGKSPGINLSEDLGLPLVKANVDGSPKNLLIDTGNTTPTLGLIVNREKFLTVPLTMSDDGKEVKRAKGCGGQSTEVRIQKNSSFSFVGHPAAYSIDTSYIVAENLTKLLPDLGSLGIEFLKRYTVTLDFSRKRLYLDDPNSESGLAQSL